jgi:hypothetical protein
MKRILVVGLFSVFMAVNAFAVDVDVDDNNAVDIAFGGTNATNVADARTNLELVPGTHIQVYSALLKSLADLTMAEGDVVYFNGTGLFNLAPGTAGKLLQTNGAGAAPSWTSAISLASIAIPNGTAPTVDAAGEIAVDTTTDQFVYFGGAKRVLAYKEPLCITVENLAAADDDYAFFSWPYAVTITSLWCHYRGTGTTPATITLEDGGGNAMTITDTAATCAASTATATPKAVTAANGLTAYEMLAFNVTNAVSPETDEYTICVSYTVDAD